MFLAPLFLAGILGIGLPILLHRIARQERIKLPFASVMLLEASEVRDTSRRSIRYWVLLALRILFLLLLVLAFAGPLVKPTALTLTSKRSCRRSCSTDRCRCSTAIGGNGHKLKRAN